MMQYMQNVLKAVMHFSFTAGEYFLMVEHPNFLYFIFELLSIVKFNNLFF